MMPLEAVQVYLSLPAFALVVARVAGLMMFQPFLSSLAVPLNVRVLIILAVAAVITPLAPAATDLPKTVGGLALGLAGEFALGALLGLVLSVVFVGAQLGGLLVAQESGLAFGQVVDPSTGEDLPVLGAFYAQIVAVVFLVVGGHRQLLAACLDTFQTIPLLKVSSLGAVGTEMLVEGLALAGVVAIRIAAPALLTLFLVNLVLGFISRTVPQLNVMTIGFALKALLAFLILGVALPTGVAAFTDALDTTVGWLNDFVAG